MGFEEDTVESLEVSARTVNDAIEKALRQLGRNRDEVSISILAEGSRGILGIGGEDARILVSARESLAAPVPTSEETESTQQAEAPKVSTADVARTAREVLESLLEGMGIDAEVRVRPLAPAAVEDGFATSLDIIGADVGSLVGRRGETLGSLQFITTLIVSRQVHHWSKVLVDVEGYRVRREQTLRGLAQRMAVRVQETGQPVTLEAMPPNERRIIHLALQSHPVVSTASHGEGEQRRVVISPKR
jgi:spoIIIJ-associated protein